MKQLTLFFSILSLFLAGCTFAPQTNREDQGLRFDAIRNHDLTAVKTVVADTDVDLDPPSQPNRVNKALAYNLIQCAVL